VRDRPRIRLRATLPEPRPVDGPRRRDRKSTRLNSSHSSISYGVFCLKKQLSLKKLMELYKIPALSVAVIENYKLVWAKAYGVTDVGASKLVIFFFLFQAASIIKPFPPAGAFSL